VVAAHDYRPTAGNLRGHESETLRHGEHRRRIERARPPELDQKPRAIRARAAGAVADHQRADARLEVATDMQESGALGSTKPFVAIARVGGGAELMELQRHHARAVRAVHERLDAARGQLTHQAFDGEDQRGLAGDMVEQGEACARRHAGEDGSDNFLRGGEREGNFRNHDLRARLFRGKGGGVGAGSVFVVGQENLISRLQRERSQERVHARRGIRYEDQVFRLRPDESSQCRTSVIQQRLQVAPEELHRLPFQAVLPSALGGQHRPRRAAEGTVIEECDGRIQQPKRVGRGHGMKGRSRKVIMAARLGKGFSGGRRQLRAIGSGRRSSIPPCSFARRASPALTRAEVAPILRAFAELGAYWFRPDR